MMKKQLKQDKNQYSVRWICACGLFMAAMIVLASFGVPVPGGGKLYLVDVAITTAALILNPIGALVVCGVGSFLGDVMFYPAAMFVTLVVHGVQGYVISWIARRPVFENHPFQGALIGVIIGAVVMVAGYTLGKIFVYSTWEYAVISLPFEILQASIGAAVGLFLTYGMGLIRLKNQI